MKTKTTKTVTKENEPKDTNQKQKSLANVQQEDFPITSICPEDLKFLGFDMTNVDDETMTAIASRLGDYCDWNAEDAKSVAEALDIPKQKTKQPTA